MKSSLISKFVTKKIQRGDFLIESLVGTFLMGIVCMGVLTVTSKVMLSQRELVTHEVVIDQMRSLMQANTHDDLCDKTSDNKKIKVIKVSGEVDQTQKIEPTCDTAILPSYRLQAALQIMPSLTVPKRVRLAVGADDDPAQFVLGGAQKPN